MYTNRRGIMKRAVKYFEQQSGGQIAIIFKIIEVNKTTFMKYI